MRNMGVILLVLGILGFFYCSSRLEGLEPVPPGLSVGEGLKYPAGKWDVARYGCGGVAAFGLLMAFFPKGR
jgi:hypothetical protein